MMTLICNATTTKELRTAIVGELRHRAWQERASGSIGAKSKRKLAEHEHAAVELENLANDIERSNLELDAPDPYTGTTGYVGPQ